MDAHPSRKIARVAILAVLSAGLVGPMAAEPAAAANREERQLRALVNEARQNHDVRGLRMRRFLVRAARQHSREMANQAVLAHSDDLASVAGDRPWSIIGENIGVGPSMEILHDAFMDSPPHRRNELNRAFYKIGVGMVRGADGRIWVTVLFMD